MKRANRSEEGQGQERTENEPEGERDCKREERAGITVGAVAGLGRSQRLTLARSHALLRCPGIRFTPNHKAAGLAFVLAVSFAGSMRRGKVGCVGLQLNARPMGYLGDD